MLGKWLLNAARDRPRTILTPPLAWIVAPGVLALLVIGPLRGLPSAAPVVLFLSVLFLFMVPGLILTHLLMDSRFSLGMRAPLAFAFSMGLFGLASVPGLLLDWSLGAYLWLCCGILALCVILAVRSAPMAARKEPPPEDDEPSTRSAPGGWLWAPFLVLNLATGFLAWAAAPPKPADDLWIYLSYVRDYLATGALASRDPFYGGELGFSRIQINGWLAEQAAFSRLSGIDPVPLAVNYLTPTLVIAGLLAVYALARALFEDGRAALVVASLNALLAFLWSALHKLAAGNAISFNAQNGVDKATFDKAIALNFFLPIALVLVVLFLKEREWRYLALFAFVCWSVMVVHPIGLAVICFGAAGFGLGYLAFHPRDRRAWASVLSVGAAPLTVILPPAIFLLAGGGSVVAERGDFADIYNTVPGVIGYLAFIGEKGNFLKFGDGSFMVSPRQLMGMGLFLAYPLGIPFLLWHALRRHSAAAQMLLGGLVFAAPLLYFPPLATFLGKYTGPSQLLRINECIRLAAVLVVGWMCWEAIKRAGELLSDFAATRSGAARRVVGSLPLIFVSVLTVAFVYYATVPEIQTQLARAQTRSVNGADAQTRSSTGKPASGEKSAGKNSFPCSEPVFRWIGDTIRTPAVVLSRDPANNCIPAYSASANVVSLRGTGIIKNKQAYENALSREIEIPQRAQDVQAFATARTVNRRLDRIISRNNVEYVLVRKDSPLDSSMDGSPGFTRMNAPRETFTFYKVRNSDTAGSESITATP